jgi:hypothetical protein
VDGEFRVFEAHGHIVRADAGHVEADAVLPRLGQHLEVHVPQPGDVAAVGVVVVYGDEDVSGGGGLAGDEGA